MLLNSTLKTCSILVAFSLSACVAPPNTQTTQQITASTTASVASNVAPEASRADPIVAANFRGGGGTWEGSGTIQFRYVAIERNGEVHICGAYTARGSSSVRILSREVMQAATVTANGETIMRNLRYFKEASSAALSNRLVGIETNCRSTGRAAGTVALESVVVQTRSGNYRVRR